MTSVPPTENIEPTPNSPDEGIKTKKGFLGLTYDELKLVVWPTKQQLFSESIAVILMVTLSAASIAAVSRFYSWAATQIFN